MVLGENHKPAEHKNAKTLKNQLEKEYCLGSFKVGVYHRVKLTETQRTINQKGINLEYFSFFA